jgi:hypothetical protein
LNLLLNATSDRLCASHRIILIRQSLLSRNLALNLERVDLNHVHFSYSEHTATVNASPMPWLPMQPYGCLNANSPGNVLNMQMELLYTVRLFIQSARRLVFLSSSRFTLFLDSFAIMSARSS